MTVAEEKVVREFLSRTPNRTSYAPSALEPEIENTHYHDMELCVLLHALDDPNQHEIAKKALRKGVRQRVKRLGMKYDNEVSFATPGLSEGNIDGVVVYQAVAKVIP